MTYDNGQKKVTYQILKGTEEDPVDVTYKAYFDNGAIMKKGMLKNMKEDGEWKYYFIDGQVSSIGNFSNGVRSGRFVRFYDTGEVEQEGYYANGIISRMDFYYRNGALKTQPLDVNAFFVEGSVAWTETEKEKTIARCNQVLQFDFKNSMEFCKCVVDSTSRYTNFDALDTLSDYDKSLVYNVFIQAGSCSGLSN